MPVRKKTGVPSKKVSGTVNLNDQYLRQNCLHTAVSIMKEQREQGLNLPFNVTAPNVIAVADELAQYVISGKMPLVEYKESI